MKIFAGALAVLGLAMAAHEASARSVLERRGNVLAARLCAPCHAIGKTGASRHADAPPFRHLDLRVNFDEFALRLRQGFMTGVHEMPVLRFSRNDARALVAYLRAIQSQ